MMTALTTTGMESQVARLALNDKDVSCGNNEPDKSVIDMGAEEDSELDLESQDNEDIINLYLVLHYGLVEAGLVFINI